MILTNEQKSRILTAIEENRSNYPSDAKHASALGIATSVYSAIKNGKTEKQLSDGQWISIARRLGVTLRPGAEWKHAKTATFVYINEKLSACQERSLSGILCDIPNIGKSFTARYYAQTHPNVVYVDCSQYKTKQRLIRHIAQEFGIEGKGIYHNVYDDLRYYLRSIEKPLIILDEAGDLQNEAFIEVKGLWNATENCCGWFMLGADGLSEKINRAIGNKKVGYAEMFSRFGSNYARVTPVDKKERESFLYTQTASVVKANIDGNIDADKVLKRSAGSLRKARTIIELERRGGA